jgi:Uncharacterised nucleotidyltransferase
MDCNMPGPTPIDLLIPLLRDPPDVSGAQDESSWKLIKEYCAAYGVAPLVASVARSCVPGEERAWCDKVLVNSWRRHEQMLRHVEKLSALFASANIPHISLKGPLLARRYYDIPFLRKPSMDVDLAVVERDLEHAVDVLVGIGYKPVNSIRYAIARDHHVELCHPSLPKVELHFRLSHMALGIPVDEFFERAISFPLPNGTEVKVLSPADQILHLVLHLTQSRFGTLFHLYEVRRVCQVESLDSRAEAVRRAAHHHFSGAIRMMDVAFRVRWNEPFLPPGAKLPNTWLHWRLTPALYRAFERWSVPGRGLSLATRLYGRWLDFQLTDGPSDAFRVAAYFATSARLQLARRQWGTVKTLRFAASIPAKDVRNVSANHD